MQKTIKNIFRRKKLLPFFTLFFLVLLLPLTVYLAIHQVRTRSQASNNESFVKCNNIKIFPNKNIYTPGETVQIVVTAINDVNNIVVNWIPSSRNLIQKPFVSEKITTGSFDPQTKAWQGTWVIPSKGEYLLMANLFQPNGQICSGNPGYTCNGCETGTKAGTDIKTVGTLPCNGCQKVIIANQINQNPSYDMKSYFNIKPGYYWQYEGINKINNTLFETRVTAEEKTTVCGHELFPLRFTKNKKEGYILADRLMNFRIFISNFQTGELWSSNTIGKLISKNYRMDPNASNLLNNLGQEIFKGDPDFVGNRHMTQDGKRTFENNYFAPHLFIEQYVNNGWSIEKIDRLMSDEKQSFESCNWTYQPSMIERYTKNSLHADYVDTPAYKGPVVRLRLIEGDNHGTGWYIREDWYFAKDIGRVQVDWKDLRQKCNHGNYTVNSPDPDCTNPAKMVNPDISMKLKSYYAGGPLTITVNPSTVSKTGKRTFYVKNNKGIPYTGQLEAKTCISESRCTPGKPFDWAYWVENGIVITDLSKISDHKTGLRHSFFRPQIETTPKGAVGETITSKTELPWSQEIQMRVQ